jgi:hypothetical protein
MNSQTCQAKVLESSLILSDWPMLGHRPFTDPITVARGNGTSNMQLWGEVWKPLFTEGLGLGMGTNTYRKIEVNRYGVVVKNIRCPHVVTFVTQCQLESRQRNCWMKESGGHNQAIPWELERINLESWRVDTILRIQSIHSGNTCFKPIVLNLGSALKSPRKSWQNTNARERNWLGDAQASVIL